jgi:hypothetical protein
MCIITHTVLPEKLRAASGSQEIKILWNPKFHYCLHNNLPPVPILGQINPIYTHKPYYTKIHVILSPSMPRSFKRSLSFRLSNQHLMHVSHLVKCYMPYPSHPTLLNLPHIWWTVQVLQLLIGQFSPPPVTSPLPLSTPSQTSSICDFPLTWKLRVFSHLHFQIEIGKTKYSKPNGSKHSVDFVRS